MLIFWFKDNLGWISTTENCSFFFLFYVILRWLSQSYEHEHSIETSGRQGSILPHWDVACYSEGFTSPRPVYRASNEARDIHWKHLRFSYVNKLFRFAFPFSVNRLLLVCIFWLLIISEYLTEIKIFMGVIGSNVLVEKLTKVLKDKHFPLTFECLKYWYAEFHLPSDQDNYTEIRKL